MTSNPSEYSGRPAGSEHLLQLFDDPQSLAESVAEFLLEGHRRDERLLVVARAAHWALLRRRLVTLGCGVCPALADGTLVVLDAPTTLAAFLRDGSPDPDLFLQHVAAAVNRLGADGHRVRIYGEMVDLLAEEGQFAAAEALEGLWDRFGAQRPFTLLCGYAAAHFVDPRAAGALAALCSRHARASAKPTDLLSTWLLSGRRPEFYVER